MSIKLFYPITAFRFPRWAKISSVKSALPRYRVQGGAVVWDRNSSKPLPLSNHIETAGLKSSLLFSYRVEPDYSIKRYIFTIFPKLRLYPNNTHSSFSHLYKEVQVIADGREAADTIEFNGITTITSHIGELRIVRSISAARDAMAAVERITLTNSGTKALSCSLKNPKPDSKTAKIFCIGEAVNTYVRVSDNGNVINGKVVDILLNPNESKIYYVSYSAVQSNINAAVELKAREDFISDLSDKLVITTPDDNINRMLQFTKLRANESIFDTKGGYMHAPGGGGFYAAMWTNDQCEYACPYFAYVGYDIAKKSSINCFDWFSKFVTADKAIVSSIIAEGDGVWHGAGDRGDNAMYVYGFTRYLLTTGDKLYALTNVDKLIMATEFFINKINSDGVVASDSDELENRFESGKANLSTSCIAYDALLSMSYLLSELNMTDKADRYYAIAGKLRSAIESYFGAKVEGYDTYRYCAEETALRSWICLPLAMGINDRAKGSIAAIMSDKLRVGNGILTRSGETIYWDRSALYALRGMFMAGESNIALSLLKEYSDERLTGEHVPYPVEAYPEGNGAHLSAESALYQRIFVEGMAGYRPIGFNAFEIKPNLPTEWNNIDISNIELSNKLYNISITKTEGCYKVTLKRLDNGKVKEYEAPLKSGVVYCRLDEVAE